MTAEMLQRIEGVFAEVSALAPAEREAALDRLCAGDAELAREVRSLLGHHQEESAAFLDPSELRAVAEAASREPVLPAGTRISGYTILGPLGEGGMGLVYRAQQERPRRVVALKLIRASMIGSSALSRFEREAEVLGLLQHPGIAQIFEAGWASTPDGPRPFIAMELVDGPPMSRFAREKGLSVRQRLELVAEICDAVHHAHQRGVIHRDLKPGNILIDPAGRPKVLDFGVSRAETSRDYFTTVHTHAGQLIGTPAYMSPEQASGDADAVDVRSDVWSLGVVLFELLTGTLPYDVHSKPVHEAARIIHDTEPRRLTQMGRQFRGDLGVIVGKALEKDRSRRYQSAAQLGDDIRAYLGGSPVSAKQDSFVYVAVKLMRRHRLASALIQASVLGAVAFAAFAWRQASIQSRLAEGERIARLAADGARAEVSRQAEELRRNLYVSAIGHAQAAYASRDADRMRRVLDQCPPNERGWEWRYLKRLADSSVRSQVLPNNGVCFALVNGAADRVVVWNGTDPIRVLDGVTGRELASIGVEDVPNGMAVSSDAGVIAWNFADGRVLAWDGRSPRPRVASMSKRAQGLVSISPDGSRALMRVFTPGVPQRAEVISLIDGALIATPRIGQWMCGAFSPDGRRVALGLPDGRVVVSEITGGAVTEYRVHAGYVWATRFSPDGSCLATGGQDGMLGLIDLKSGGVRRLPVSDNKTLALAWSPDGAMVAVSGTEPVIRVVEVETPRVVSSLLGHGPRIDSLGWREGVLVSTGRDGTLRWWNDPATDPTLVRSLPGAISALAVDPSGTCLYVGVDRGRTVVLSPLDLSTLGELPRIDDDISTLTMSPDGTRLVASCYSSLVVVFDLCRWTIQTAFAGPTGRSLKVAFSPGGERFVLGSDADAATVWETDTGELLDTLPSSPLTANCVAWSPDGSLIAVGHVQSGVQLFDAGTRTELRRLRGYEVFPYSISFTGDGRHLYAGDETGGICVWDPFTGELLRRLKGHQHGVYVHAFSGDGSRLVTGGWDNTVRVWDVFEGQELLNLRGHTGGISGVVFMPDGSSMISASSDSTIRLWSAKPAQAR